jgi:hypothetical protein
MFWRSGYEQAVMNEDEIRRLLAKVPVEHRIHARAALTGSADELSGRVGGDKAISDGWQAGLGTLFMAEFAARYRSPAEVAEIAGGLCGEVSEGVVVDVAAERHPQELAAIATELFRVQGDTTADPEQDLVLSFLRAVAARRLPADLACMLVALRHRDRLRKDLMVLISAEEPGKIAQIVVHLRGMGADARVAEILAEVKKAVPSGRLASFIVGLARCGDRDTVQQVIADATAWDAPSEAPDAPSEALPDLSATAQAPEGVTRIAELVAGLLDNRRPDLAEQVITSAVKDFAESGEQYRLYALVFVFQQHGLGDQAERIMEKISASANKDEVEMIIQFCKEQEPEPTAALLRVILEKPRPGVTEGAAVKLAKGLPQEREAVFGTVAAWQYENLREFERQLRRNSPDWAKQFRDMVAISAGNRDDGDDIAALARWLLEDADAGRGKRLAAMVVEEAVKRRDPGLMIAVICQLHDRELLPSDRHKGWWTLRDGVASRIAADYTIKDLVGLVEQGKDSCLATLLWLVPEWLTHRARTDTEVVTLVRGLKEAGANPRELLEALTFSAIKFSRVIDQSTPLAALRRAGLDLEADAWAKGKNSTFPFRYRRPDPDPVPS